MSKCGSQSLLEKERDGAPSDDTGRQLLSVRGGVGVRGGVDMRVGVVWVLGVVVCVGCL